MKTAGLCIITWGLVFALTAVGPFVQSPGYCNEKEKDDPNNWIDWGLPRLVSVVPFEGERYPAEIPDTIDLVDHANYALNMGTRLWAPEWGYEILNGVDLKKNPPVFSLGSGGLLTESAKIVEALPMLRVMTGSTFNIDMDANAIMSFVRVTGRDGLCYYPVENCPWAFFDDYTRTINKPYSDVFAEGRQLMAYAAWYQHDRNPLWKQLAERKIRRLQEMTLRKEDTFFFRLSRGYTPWDDPLKGDVVPVGDHNVYEKDKGMVGTPAAVIVGWIPQGGGMWYRLTQEKLFENLSRGLARYLLLHGEMIDPGTGQYLADHETHVTHSLLSNLSWALSFGDPEMAQWVKKGFDYHLKFIDADRTGILIGQEACLVSDTIGIGIMLSQADLGDYWDAVDRFIRNTFLDMQVTDVSWIKQQPYEYSAVQEPGNYQFEDGADRCLGVWRHRMGETAHFEVTGCCNGNCSRELYFIWDNILTHKNGQLRVNLLMNRASPWADVDSWLPYEGRVLVTVKSEHDALYMRIPDWVDKSEVSCSLNGEKMRRIWAGEYLDVGHVDRDARIVVEFPIPVTTREVVIPILLEQDGEREVWDRRKHTATFRGNTLLDIHPRLDGYPIENHLKYQADKAPVKQVVRFVSNERFLF